MEPTSKERILKKIRKALIQSTPQPFLNIDQTSSVYTAPTEGLDVLFAQNFTAIQGSFIYCENKMEFIKSLNTLCDERGWNHLYTWERELQTLFQDHDFRRCRIGVGLEKADAGVTQVECLVARTGSILISSRQESGRALPIFPPVHIAVAYTNQLVFDIKDAMQLVLQKYEKNMPGLINIATGPSRTADIEKTLVLGAHGPKEVFVFLIEDNAR